MKIVPYVILFDIDVERKIAEDFCGQMINIEYWEDVDSYIQSRIPEETKYELYEISDFQDEFNYEGFNASRYWLGYLLVNTQGLI